MIEKHDPEIFGQGRRDQPPHVLIAAEPVGEHHHRLIRTASEQDVVPAADPHVAHNGILSPATPSPGLPAA
jgi:hypothetical protein